MKRLSFSLSLLALLSLAFGSMRSTPVRAACAGASESDYMGYWRFMGEQPFKGDFQPPKLDSGWYFSNGDAIPYENGHSVWFKQRYSFDSNGSLVLQGMPFNSAFTFRDCDKNILDEQSKPLLSVDVFQRRTLPSTPQPEPSH